MSLRGLTAEQLFDSLAEATEYATTPPANPAVSLLRWSAVAAGPVPGQVRRPGAQPRSGNLDPPGAIPDEQRLRHRPDQPDQEPDAGHHRPQRTSTARKVETLYLVVLSRKPRSAESERGVVKYVEQAGSARDQAQALTDVFWVLLNQPRVMLNH